MTVQHLPSIAVVDAGHTAPSQVVSIVSSGEIDTANGPLSWSRLSNGTLRATGAGQKLDMTTWNASNGSHSQVVFARDGEDPYLTVLSVVNEDARWATLNVTGVTSHLALTLDNIDEQHMSATATVTGSVGTATGSAASHPTGIAGSAKAPTATALAIQQTGKVDLSSNPTVGEPLPGWPANVFVSEMSRASFFAPLRETIMPAVAAARGHVIAKSAGGIIIKGLAYGALAALGAVGVGSGVAVVILAGGIAFDGSVVGDLIDYIDTEDVEPEVPAAPDIPSDEEAGTKFSSTSQDDPPPPTDGTDPDPDPDPGGGPDPGGNPGGGEPA
jgi:hypothetical protein